MVRVSRRFVNESLWPEFLDTAATLRAYLEEIADRLASEAIQRAGRCAPFPGRA